MTAVRMEPGDYGLLVKQVTAMPDSLLFYLYYVCLVSHPVKSSHLLPLYRSQDLPSLLHIPKFQKPDTLPCSCSELSIRDWYAHASAYQRRLDMCLHRRPISHFPRRGRLGANIPAYHRSPLHHACRVLFQLLVQYVSPGPTDSSATTTT